jgi:4-amino-4-deoxy-L-arabinose transferase-like glycosyltransferase
MLRDTLFSLLLFFVTVPGLGWLLACRLPFAPAEKICAAAALAVLGVFLFAWADYVFALPLAALWFLPVLGAASLGLGWRGLVDAWRDADAHALVVGQLLITGWCIGWLATIASYSGGGWAGDWFEHWERVRFFLERAPLDQKFLGHDLLTARPPLANVVTAAFLALTRADFAHFQLSLTLLATLSFLPAGLLARRFGRSSGAISLCAVLFMVSPLFVQNATFAWTKLPAAFFALTALYFFLRAQEPGAPTSAALLFAASLAAALLAHYSAGPYAVMLALGWLWLGWPRRNQTEWRRATTLGVLVGALVLAVWFGWAVGHFGARGTFLANSSVEAAEKYSGSQFEKIALNLRDTLVPHFLRRPDVAFIAQSSPWGHWRDWFFQCYQLNLPLACGSVAWLAILIELRRVGRGTDARPRAFWWAFAAGVIVLGVATHGARDTWGLTHICLQTLVLLTLAFLAARWSALSRAWRLALLAGATVDLALGILLHFGVQSYALDRWLAANQPPEQTLHSYTEWAFMNLAAKIHHQLTFFSDALALPLAVLLAGLAALLAIAVVRARRA